MIERADEDDEESFVELYLLSYRGLEEYAYRSRRDVKSYFRWLMRRDPGGLFKYLLGNEPVGFIACDSNWISYFEERNVGEIHELFVHPEHRKKGIGRGLVERGIQYFREKGLELCELWVGERNEDAKRFYSSLGFREQGSWGKWIRMIKRIQDFS
ncbi:MAG: hypothetical protein PWR13_346 [Archaeoglobi archaeon]|nr:GNAT family N-acetyltransferase [Candidatus Mnemosynella bozhongmuii]MDI3502769.1 hypothetical protein [Archaeoglobi archaeon]MDK2781318.1 hypothetical protein [Archaeoglobi archaeon]